MQPNTNPNATANTTVTTADVICRTHELGLICRTHELGLTITHAATTDARTIIHATPTAPTNTCPDCDHPGAKRDHTTRRLVDLPIAGYPTILRVRLPRYTCTNPDCGRRIFTSNLACAAPKTKITTRVADWIVTHLADAGMSIAAIARTLGIGWELVNTIATTTCTYLTHHNPHHLDNVRIIGVDEHKWKHTHTPGGPPDFVTVIVDITPTVDGTGTSRLLDVVPGRSAHALTSWLES